MFRNCLSSLLLRTRVSFCSVKPAFDYTIRKFSSISSYNNIFTDKSLLVKKVLEDSKDVPSVTLLNGVSCVGKTTLSNNLLKFSFNIISYDDIFNKLLFVHLFGNKASGEILEAQKALITNKDIQKVYYGFKINKEKYQNWQLPIVNKLKFSFSLPFIITDEQVNASIYEEAKKFIFRGEKVVIDIVQDSAKIDMMRYYFNNHPISTVLLYSSLEENLKKCFSRNILSYKKDLLDYRPPSKIIEQYCSFYKFVGHTKITLNSIVLEKVDKVATKAILDQVISHESFLLSYIYDDVTPKRHKEQIEDTLSILEKAKNSMMLSSNEEVFVVPLVESDYILYQSDDLL